MNFENLCVASGIIAGMDGTPRAALRMSGQIFSPVDCFGGSGRVLVWTRSSTSTFHTRSLAREAKGEHKF